MSKNKLTNKVILALYVTLSIAHAATSLFSKLFPNLPFISLMLTVSTFASATILYRRWETGEEE